MKRAITVLAILAGVVSVAALTTRSVPRVECVGVSDGSAHICEYHPRAGTGDPVYITVTEYMNWLAWGSQPGDIPVQETYVKTPATPANGRRVIAFADNVVIADTGWLAKFPANTLPPVSCSLNGTTSKCTTIEQRTALDFQHSIVVNDVDYPL